MTPIDQLKQLAEAQAMTVVRFAPRTPLEKLCGNTDFAAILAEMGQMTKERDDWKTDAAHWRSEWEHNGEELIEQAKEIDRLRAIVDKLPVTADGVPVVLNGSPVMLWIAKDEEGFGPYEEHCYDRDDISKAYFTREAAEAAAKGNQ